MAYGFYLASFKQDCFFLPSYQQLFDTEFAEISLTHETLIEVDVDHSNICTPARGSELVNKIEALIRETMT